MLVGWELGHSIFYDVCLEQDNYHWKIILHCYASSLLVLWMENFGWGFFFFFCTWQYFWVASFFSSKFGIYQTEKEPRQLAVIPWVLRSVTHLPSSLHLSKSSYVSFYVNVQNFSLNLPRELGTSTTSSSSSRSFPCVHFIMSFITLSL